MAIHQTRSCHFPNSLFVDANFYEIFVLVSLPTSRTIICFSVLKMWIFYKAPFELYVSIHNSYHQLNFMV